MKRENLLFIKIVLLIIFSAFTQITNAQVKTKKWTYISSFSAPYYLERTWLTDTVFVDKYFYDTSDIFWEDTFYIRKKDCYFKRGNTYYPYLSPSAFERGDTIVYYDRKSVIKYGYYFTVRDYYLPVKTKRLENNLLVYVLNEPVDDPKYASSKVYFDPERYLITKITTIDGVQTILEK